MFSFFRKSRVSKDSKLEQQQHNPPSVDDGKVAAEGSSSKKKLPSADKKTNKDKKVSFKDADPVNDSMIRTPDIQRQENLVVENPAEEKTNDLLQSEEPPDVFCEAQETIQPVTSNSEPLSTCCSQPSAVDNVIALAPNLADEAIKSVSHLSSDNPPEQPAASDVNPNDSGAQDVTQRKLLLTMKKSHPDVLSTAPFLSAGSSTVLRCEKQSIFQHLWLKKKTSD